MAFFKRIFGICETKRPVDDTCWSLEESKISVDLSRASELRSAGGAFRLEGKGLPDRFLVLADGDGGYRAYRNRCTHAGRRLDPLGDSGEIRCCSVSKSSFDPDGNVRSGPAKGPLKSCRVIVAGDSLSIELP
jgi:nitrite reductase/ring-hydroxylating ferredoxin subunit